MTDKKIMIMNGQPSEIEIIKEHLTTAGYNKIFSAFDSVQSIQIAMMVKPDLILLDMNMPEGGENVYKRLKQMVPTQSIPAIFIMRVAPERIQEVIDETDIKTENIITKPINFEELLEKIRFLFSGNEQKQNMNKRSI